MDPTQRHETLERWVAWFNAHRDKVTPELERELDRTLAAASRVDVDVEQMEKMQHRFDQWLKTAGYLGVGRGPGEPESGSLDG